MSSVQRIFIAGHKGMVGSAILRELKNNSTEFDLITASKSELDLTSQKETFDFLASEKPDQIYLAAAKVGGIHANNTYPADFIYNNLAVQCNVIHGAFRADIKKLLFLGSSCIYPKQVSQPMEEDSLLTGELELTNEPYAVAKIAGIKLCESYNRQYFLTKGVDFRSVMPTNLYGPGDNYHLDNSHVIPGLIHKFHLAKQNNESEVVLWGTGTPRREFLFVDDMARASIHVMNLSKHIYDRHISPQRSHINVGSGEEMTIKALAHLISKVVGYNGAINFDESKPDGAKRKLMNSARLNSLGWKKEINIEDGLKIAYLDFLEGNNRL